MSHVVSVSIEVKDRAALEAAAERVGLVAVDTPEWDWFGRWVDDYSAGDAAYRNGIAVEDYGKCEFALVQASSPLGCAALAARAAGRAFTAAEAEEVRVKHHGEGWRRDTRKPYSVGVVKDPKGGFRLVYDFYAGGNGLRGRIGEGAALLKQAYGVCAARAVAVRAGHRVVAEQALPDGSIRLQVQLPGTKARIG